MTWSLYYVSVCIYYPQPPDLPHSRDDPRRTEEVGPIQGVNAILSLFQIIQEIEGHYFEEGDVDCSQHELEVSACSVSCYLWSGVSLAP